MSAHSSEIGGRMLSLGAMAATALLASACPRVLAGATDAGSDAPSAPADAATDAGAAPAATTAAGAAAIGASDGAARPPLPFVGWAHPARFVVVPDGLRTTREEFVRTHRAARETSDASCWSRGLEICSCGRMITTDTATGSMDVLVCEHSVDPAPSALLPGIGARTVLYAVEKGTLKLLLDVPTRATVDPENGAAGNKVGSVELRAVASPGGVTFVDHYENDAGPWCPQAVARAAGQRGQDWPLVKRSYAAVCATAGRYVLEGGRLVKGG